MWTDQDFWESSRVKKVNLQKSLVGSHAYNPIRNSHQTFDETFWREKSRQESCPESRIRLYEWLPARLSPRIVFFTRVLHRQITEFIVANDILDSRQSEFRGGYSTPSAVLRVCHEVRQAVDLGRVTTLVLFHFSKASDAVNHSRLLIKLYGLELSDGVVSCIFSYE